MRRRGAVTSAGQEGPSISELVEVMAFALELSL